MNKRRFSLFLLIVLLLAFGGIFGLSAYKIISYYSVSIEEADGFNTIAKALEEAQIQAQNAQTVGEGTHSQDSDAESEPYHDSAVNSPDAILAGYAALKKTVPDLFGWIKIEGTVINYPVMHTPAEPEKYLHMSFDGKQTKSGTPFLAAECYEGCKNYIIYAHNMKNGSMFAKIPKYNKKSFWEEHKTVCFDTSNNIGEYTVFAAFYADVGKNSDFKYFSYTDLTDEDKFNEYLGKIRENAIYDTGIEPEFGDELLTLSTCTNRDDDERFVVVAKRK